MGTPRIAMLATAAAILVAACGSDKETVIVRESAPKSNHAKDQVYFFSGHIYDGTDGTRLLGYSLDIQYRDVTLNAKVDGDGRFSVGPIPYFQDYTVRIHAEGYRSFMSHNEGIEFEWYDTDGMKRDAFAPEVGFYYNAFLFPDHMIAPETTVYVTARDSDAKLSGQVRFVPADSPDMAVLPAVSGQTWTNDDDYQQRWVTVPLVDGVAVAEEGELVYGVEYTVVVFDVPGYEPDFTSVYAGWEDVVTLSLYQVWGQELRVVYRSTEDEMHSPDGSVFFVFNRPIEFGPRFSRAEYTEFVEASMSIAQEAGGTNALNDPEDGRGLTISISENVLTFSWDPEDGLDVVDDDHAITSITYGNLNQIRLRPVGRNHEFERTLSAAMSGTTSVTVEMVP